MIAFLLNTTDRNILDQEMEKYLEALVETEDIFKDCEKVLGPLSEKSRAKTISETDLKGDITNTKLDSDNYSCIDPGKEAVNSTTNTQSKLRGDGYDFVSTILASCNDVYLNSEHLLNLLQHDEWIETEIIDFYCLHLQQRGKLKQKITITPSAYVYLNNRERNEWIHARNAEIPWKDTLVLFDTQQQEKHVHPLLLNNHFVLIELDRKTKTCVIYDSFKNKREQNQPGILEDDRQLIKTHVLPDFFMSKESVFTWKVEHFEDMPQQNDQINCGIFVMSIAKDIINGHSSKITTPKGMEEQRMEIAREILLTTEQGVNLLNIAGNNNKLLKSLIQSDVEKAKQSLKEFYIRYEENKKKMALQNKQ